MQATIQTTVKRSERKIASNILKGSLGNMIEWFDWYVYASFAIYFSGAFFPANNQTAELLATAGVFAIGFCGPWDHSSWDALQIEKVAAPH